MLSLTFFHLSYDSYEAGTIITLVLQMGKLRLRQRTSLAQINSKGGIQNPGSQALSLWALPLIALKIEKYKHRK